MYDYVPTSEKLPSVDCVYVCTEWIFRVPCWLASKEGEEEKSRIREAQWGERAETHALLVEEEEAVISVWPSSLLCFSCFELNTPSGCVYLCVWREGGVLMGQQ